MKRFIIAIMTFFAFTSIASAKDIGGVSLPDTLSTGKEQLLLNGAGLRKKFVVTVYAGGLYLLQKSNDAAKIIAADEPMAVRMHFIYNGASAKDVVAVWNEGFAKTNTSAIKTQIELYNSFFKQDPKKGDTYDFVYVPGHGVNVSMNGKAVGTIEGSEFKKALFGIWLGESPADKDLKNGMLGK